VRWTVHKGYLPTRADEYACTVCDGLFTWGLAARAAKRRMLGQWRAVDGPMLWAAGTSISHVRVCVSGFPHDRPGPMHLPPGTGKPSLAIHALPNKGWALAVQG